jgi:hypothetical protein
MSQSPEEVAIRSALERIRPTSVPSELTARLDGIPDEVGLLRPLAVRLALDFAPWALVAGMGIVLAFNPLLLVRAPSATVSSAADGWTASAPGGGFADVGWFGLPWIPFLIAVGVIASIERVVRALRLRDRVPSPKSKPPPMWVRHVAITLPLIVALSAVSDHDPIVYGSVGAPGPEVTDVSSDANWFDEKDQSGWGESFGAPHYVFRLRPGDAFSYLISVRNDWPLPVTLLGLSESDYKAMAAPGAPIDYRPIGLGLLRDPTTFKLDAGDVEQFHPVSIGAGEEVAIVVASIAGFCADPAGEADPATPPGVTLWDNRRLAFVYEVAGWRRVGVTYPAVGVTVPTTAGCLPGL